MSAVQSTTRFHNYTTACKQSSSLYRVALASFIMAMSANGAMAQVGSGEQVVGGTAQFNRPDANTLEVTTQEARTIINWQNLDILNNQSAHFNQQAGANAVTLNRIGGGSPTQILGTLTSNGKLVLVNPNGVFFGAGSRVDVAGLVATTADISNNAFMAGSTNFNIAGRADASIINKGTITAAEGGLVALVAPAVRNDGVIIAKAGKVILGAAQTVTVDFYGDKLYSFKLGDKTTAAGKDENGNTMSAAVENNGMIIADAGSIYLTANAAKDVVTHAVNNTGILEATAARVEGGEIVLDGGEGNVKVAGIVDVSGKLAGQKGGKVTVTGKNIHLAGAKVDASGAAAGGTVKVGGDYQGGGDLAHADVVYADSDSSIDVSALDNGNAGTAILWSDGVTSFSGRISGRGGINGGKGGFAEISSLGELGFDGLVDLGAALSANNGTLLLDPTNIVVSGLPDGTVLGTQFIRWTSLQTSLASSNVLLSATNDISFLHDVTWGSANTLGANAGHDINVTGVTLLATGSGGIDFTAGNNINVNGSLTTNSGSIKLDAHNDVKMPTLLSQIKSETGDVLVKADHDLAMALGAKIDGGNVTLDVARNLSLDTASSVVADNDITVKNADLVNLKALSGLNAGRDITIDSNVGAYSSDSASYLTAGRNILVRVANALGFKALSTATTLGGNIDLESTGGDVTIDGSLLTASGHVNVKTLGKVTLLGGSLISAGNGILIDNGDDFYSQNANTLNTLLGTIKVNQAEDGSIQNAIDAIGLAVLGSNVHLLNGSWTENVNINLSNFTLDGSGMGASTVYALNNAGPVINTQNQLLVTIKDLTVDGQNMTGGIAFDTVGGAFVNNVAVNNYTTGISLNGVTGFDVSNNTLTQLFPNPNTGISLTGGTTLGNVSGNVITHGLATGLGINADGVSLVNISGNTVDNAAGGIWVNGSDTVSLLGNILTNVGYIGINLTGNSNLVVAGNEATAETTGLGTGILIGAGNSFLLPTTLNTVNNFATGIEVNNPGTLLTLNTMNGNTTGLAIYADNVTSLINFINGGGRGIYGADSSGLNLTGNIIDGVSGNGIELVRVSDSELTANVITAAAGNANSGIYSVWFDGGNTTGNRYTANVVTGFGGVGIHANGNGNATLKYNVLTNNGTGIALTYGSNNSLVEGNVITGSNTGIYTSYASDNTIKTNIITGVKGDGIYIHESKGPGWDTNAHVTGNIITAAAGNTGSGIVFDHVVKANAGDGTLAGANIVTGFGTGITVDHSNAIDILGNGLLGVGTGIDASHVNGLNISGLNVIVADNDGVHVRNADGLTVDGNAIIAGRDGVNIRYAKNFSVDGNGIGADRDGVRIADSGFIGSGQPHFTVDGNIIVAGRDGVALDRSYNFDVNGNTIGASRDGIATDQTGWFSIAGNGIIAGKEGIQIDSANNFDVTGNGIAAGRDGITVDGANTGLITGNLVGAVRDGVTIGSAGYVDVDGNLIGAGRDGVTIANAHDFGVDGNVVVAGRDGVNIAHVNFFDVTGNLIGAGRDGLVISDSGFFGPGGLPIPALDSLVNFTVSGNLIGALRDGVSIFHANNFSIAGNAVIAGRDGVHVNDGANFTLASNLVGAVRNGVSLYDTLDTDVTGNLIGALNNGINVDGASLDTRITGNGIIAANDGIYINGSDGNVITGNGIFAGHNGISLINSDPLIAGNFIVALNNGIYADNADNLEVASNIILAGHDGVHVKNGNNFNIHHNIIGAGHDGVHVRTQTGDAIVASNIIGAGRDGVNSRYTNGLNVSNNFVAAGRDGVRVRNAGAFNITNNIIFALHDGVSVRQGGNFTVDDNFIIAGRDGVHVDQAALFSVDHNLILAGRDGVNVNGSGLFGITENGIIALRDGVNVNSASTFLVAGNGIIAVRDGAHITNSGLFAVAANGIIAGRDGISVDSSGLFGVALNFVAAGRDGIHLTDTFGNLILSNDILAGRDGIYGRNLLGSVIADNTVYYAGRDGIHLQDAGLFAVAANRVNAVRDGVNIDNAGLYLVGFNTIHAGRDGIHATDTIGSLIIGNDIDAGRDGIFARNLLGSVIAGNTVHSAGRDGIHLRNAALFAVAGNDVTATRDGVNIDNAGLYLVGFNTIHAGRDGIHATDGIGNIIVANDIDAGRDGIFGRNLLGSVIAGNSVLSSGRDGIHLIDSAFNLIALNDTHNAGRHGFNLENADYSIIAGNSADGSNNAGFRLVDSRDVVFLFNNANANDIGFDLDGGNDNVTLVSNTASNNTGIGARVRGSDDIRFVTNTFTNNFIGAQIVNTNDTVFTGDIFTGNTLGINLNNSDNTRIENATITTAAGGTGIQIENGSGGTIVRNLNISGGNIGVLIDGPGSDMQFEGDTSQFAGNMNYYFVLQNNAMEGQTLDASQQFFDGTRGVDMTFAQWLAAEAKTIDMESQTPIGNVFYNNFENLADLGALDEAERKRKGLYRAGLFSYAGKTLANNIEEKPFSFEVAKLDLSLLNKANTNPQTPASIANFFATLAPAAGGKPANPAQMAQQFAELNPAAGGTGLGGGDSSGNNYLDAGANLDYNLAQ